MYDIRRYLTDRQTALGLIGTSQAGKSTFAKLAFGVDSKPGSGMDSRTRVLRNWTVPFPENRIRNREFTLIDFPGSTDQAAPHWYIRGQLLASVLVVVLPLDEMSTVQAIDLVKKVSFLITCAQAGEHFTCISGHLPESPSIRDFSLDQIRLRVN